MIWAIDLDDGTLINALGSDLSRPPSVLSDLLPVYPDFETRFEDL
jgi:chitinase